MRMLLKDHLVLFARLGRQEGNPDPVVVAKFFTPWTYFTWYATEFDPQSGVFFGFTVGHSKEWGYFSLAELESVRGPGGLRIERDLYFVPTPFSQIRH